MALNPEMVTTGRSPAASRDVEVERFVGPFATVLGGQGDSGLWWTVPAHEFCVAG